MSDTWQHTGGSTPYYPTNLSKGSACTNCRKRKIKCDGARPKCRACHSSVQFNDCEYADYGFTQTQYLEERIAALSARINELEALPSTVASPTSIRSPSSEPASLSLQLPYGSGQGYSSSERSESLPNELHQRLIQGFLQHTADLPFFLDVGRFLAIVAPRTSHQKATLALLETAYLWGAHLSADESLKRSESDFVSRALRGISQGMSGGQPGPAIIHLIQAETLLSHYFFRSTRILEGKYHMAKALSLVTAGRLHTIRSAEGALSASYLPPPTDAIEEGERINAFWMVLGMNNGWTAIDGSPSNVVYTNEPGLRIDTPWPEDMDTYATNGIRRDLTGSYTVQRFLAGLDRAVDGQSRAALVAKASILFERATQVGMKHWKNITSRSSDTPRSTQEFLAIGSLIQSLTQQMSSYPATQLSVISILLNAASMRLHQNFVDKQAQSRQLTISSARNIVRALASIEGGVVDPILAPIAMITFQFLVEELRKVTSSSSSSSAPVKVEMQKLVKGMTALASSCPLMGTQATEARRTLEELGARLVGTEEGC
ncbi:hypothetical protein V5O48_014686 [Marasmius crinis-equi]|uniref:Zn(2)-C6 fungal-type domain-containing protein n=1 Tax=Marasmius crinis-equi TaxID=585013 RepID=A0ABR3EWP3_9AGAR